METNQRDMPPVMRALHEIPIDATDEDGIDFEPSEEFLSPTDTQSWFSAWTGNAAADGSRFLVFGQDGTGGYGALWLVRDSPDLLQQPVVFFGSEGELGVIAQNFSDYLWLLAGGHGPFEAVSYLDDEKAMDPDFTEFAKAHATTPQATPTRIIARARAEFPDFERDILALCR